VAVELLTPAGALVAVAAIAPLSALVVGLRRANAVRQLLRLGSAPRSVVLDAGAVTLAVALVGLAAAQPVLRRAEPARTRTDAQAFVVLDTSRSMLASAAAGSPTRLDRAKLAARQIRQTLAEVPVGLASMTDRVLPHLFPSADEGAFASTLALAVAIEQPPPRDSTVTATALGSLAALGTANYFDRSVRNRVAVVLTDGESRDVDSERLRAALATGPGVKLVFVHVGEPGEAVRDRNGAPEPGYLPDSRSRRRLDELAATLGGRAFVGTDAGAAGRSAAALLGGGTRVERGRRESVLRLAPALVLAAFAPLGLLLARRSRRPPSGAPLAESV
jgi:hypothetical protein